MVPKYNSPKSKSFQLAFATVFQILIFFPIFLSTLLLWLPIRALIVFLVCRTHPKMEPFEKGVGLLVAHRSTRTRPVGNLVYHLICKGSVSLDQLRDQFYNNILEFEDPQDKHKVYRRLRYYFRPIFQVLFWQEDSSFHLKKHIRMYDLNESGLALPKDSVTEDDLMRVTGGLVSRSYAPNMSPWELLLIPNFKGETNEDLTIITLRIHHGLADGLSCIGLICRLFGASAPPPLAKFPQLKMRDKFFRAMFVTVRAPYELARVPVHFNDEYSSWKLPLESYSDDFVSFCSNPIPWNNIKKIMNKYDVNSNAAIYSIIAGALVQMIKGMGQEVPFKLSTFTSYPLPNHPGGLCNHVTYSGFQFNPPVHMGPALVQHIGSQVKAANFLNPLAAVMDAMSVLQSLLPIFIAKKCMAGPSTFVFTHFPGPLGVLQDLNFATLLDIIPAFDSGRLGSTSMAVSTAGNIRIGLTVDKAVIPEESGHLNKLFDKLIKAQMDSMLLETLPNNKDFIKVV